LLGYRRLIGKGKSRNYWCNEEKYEWAHSRFTTGTMNFILIPKLLELRTLKLIRLQSAISWYYMLSVSQFCGIKYLYRYPL
jgi:hypothetical protein